MDPDDDNGGGGSVHEEDNCEEDAEDDQERLKDYAEDDADVLADLDPYEHVTLMEDTAAICTIVIKVHLTPSHTTLMMNSYAGSKTCLCNNSLNDDCTAGLVSCLQ